MSSKQINYKEYGWWFYICVTVNEADKKTKTNNEFNFSFSVCVTEAPVFIHTALRMTDTF